MLKRISVFFFIMSTSVAVIAGPNPYSDCGIGAAMFQNTPWAAATSNATWDLGSSAVTSATVSPETCSSGNTNVQTAQFIINNYDNLLEETAKGQGEHLITLLDIQGCSSQNQQNAIQAIRSNMSHRISLPGYKIQDPVDKAYDYYIALNSATSICCAS